MLAGCVNVFLIPGRRYLTHVQTSAHSPAFATIPAQNATGNWIKVVQRVPVRIQLQPEELAANPLSVGVSMKVRVDTRSD